MLKVADLTKKGWTDLSLMFNQKASMYSDPSSEVGYQACSTDIHTSYHDEIPSSNSSSSTPSPYHTSEKSNESSNLLTDSPKPSKVSNSISREEKTLGDFGKNSSTKTSKSKKADWNDGWDDEAWSNLKVDIPKGKSNKKS